MARYKCKHCGYEVDIDTEEDFDDWGEEELWGHIQSSHEEVFNEVQDWATPYMIEECYEQTL